MTWPPASNVPADATPGQRIYIERCGFCHGPDGRGNGTSAPSMIPRPRDFAQGQFKYKSTPEGAPPSDDDLIKVVTDGLHASAMPYFRGILSDADIRTVVAYVKGLAKIPANAKRGADRCAATAAGHAGKHRARRGALCRERLRGLPWRRSARRPMAAGRQRLSGHQPRSHRAMDLSRRRCARRGILAALDRIGAGADARLCRAPGRQPMGPGELSRIAPPRAAVAVRHSSTVRARRATWKSAAAIWSTPRCAAYATPNSTPR